MSIFNWTNQPEKLTAWNQQLKSVDKYGNQTWYKNGKLDRDGDKPAEIWTDGSKFWYKNGKLDRDGDLPAEIGADGYQAWYKNGQLHRDGDKPAAIYASGMQQWYKNGQLVARSQREFQWWVNNIGYVG